ncbi:MAG: tail fiber protein [Phycisphaerae bacterium]|jgi:microcystin-dependent protein
MFGKGFSLTLFAVLAAMMGRSSVASASVDPYIGEIMIVPYNYAPRDWAFCNGQLLPIAQHAALYSLLGTTYGGDGVNTFGVPDLRGRVAIHAGIGPGLTNRRLGEMGGYEAVALTVPQMPAHSHEAMGYSEDGNQEGPGGNVWAKKDRNDDYSSHDPNVAMSVKAIGIAGGNQPHQNMQPYLVLNYVIAMEGAYPPRN